MIKPTQIYIDDSGAAHVSHQCDSCSVWVRTDEHCGDDGQYLCPDCYGRQRADQKFIHDWLVFTNDDNLLECGPFAIHKDIVHRDRINDADCSTHEPEEGLPRFGPGILAMSMNSIEDLFFDVNDVHRLFDEGFLNNKAHLIFKRGE